MKFCIILDFGKHILFSNEGGKSCMQFRFAAFAVRAIW